MSRRAIPMTRQEERLIRLHMEYHDLLKQIRKAKQESKKIDLKKWEAIFPPLDKLSPEELNQRREELLKVRERMEEEKQRRIALAAQKSIVETGCSTSESKE